MANPAPQRVVGIVFDEEQIRRDARHPRSARWNTPRWLASWVAAAQRLGLGVKLVGAGDEWGGVHLLIVPGLEALSRDHVARLDAYAEAGGHLVLTCRTALLDSDGHRYPGPIRAPIMPLIGGRVEAHDALPGHSLGTVEMDRLKYPWGVWADLLYADPGTRVLAQYADRFHQGAAAAVQRRHGTGTVTYCGVYGEQPFINAFLEKIALQAGIVAARATDDGQGPSRAANPLPEGAILIDRSPYRILLNYSMQTVMASSGGADRFIVGQVSVEPCGVAVWEPRTPPAAAPEPVRTGLRRRRRG